MNQTFPILAYTFVLVTYLASAVTEGLSLVLRWRARMLYQGVQKLLDDRRTLLTQTIYAHPLINPYPTRDDIRTADAGGFAPSLPSYINPRDFAVALSQSLGLTDSMSPDELRQKLTENAALRDSPNLRTLLCSVIPRSGGDRGTVLDSVAAWFDNATARITVAYKRRIQLSSFLIGLIIAMIFDINPLPPAIDLVVGGDQVKASPKMTSVAGDVSPSASSKLAIPQAALPGPSGAQGAGARSAVPASSNTPGLPVAPRGKTVLGLLAMPSWILEAVGWMLTAVSTLLVSPFWFDLLSKISPVR